MQRSYITCSCCSFWLTVALGFGSRKCRSCLRIVAHTRDASGSCSRRTRLTACSHTLRPVLVSTRVVQPRGSCESAYRPKKRSSASTVLRRTMSLAQPRKPRPCAAYPTLQLLNQLTNPAGWPQRADEPQQSCADTRHFCVGGVGDVNSCHLNELHQPPLLVLIAVPMNKAACNCSRWQQGDSSRVGWVRVSTSKRVARGKSRRSWIIAGARGHDCSPPVLRIVMLPSVVSNASVPVPIAKMLTKSSMQ